MQVSKNNLSHSENSKVLLYRRKSVMKPTKIEMKTKFHIHIRMWTITEHMNKHKKPNIQLFNNNNKQ